MSSFYLRQVAKTDQRLRVVVVIAITFLVLAYGTASAISRGYATDETDLRPGMVVALSADSSPTTPKIVKATSDNADKVVGVITTLEDGLITLTASSDQVYVEDDGTVSVYVSDLNGEVRQGDRLALSPIKGVAAKATSFSMVTIGTALEDFSTASAESYDLRDEKGATKSVKLLKMGISFGTMGTTLREGDSRSGLQRAGDAVAGRPVGYPRLVAALIIFLLVLVAEGSLLYGAVSGAIVSFGRNPLAKGLIRGELIRMVFITFGVLLIGLAAVFAVLRV